MKHELTGNGGKGSAPRAVDKAKFNDGWDRIFGKEEPSCPQCYSLGVDFEWMETNGQEWQQGFCHDCDHEWHEDAR